jgi:hypothetical protein
MHPRDRRLYVILAWTAIPAALIVGCFIAWGTGQLSGLWASVGVIVGLAAMFVATLYALEKKAPAARYPGPIIVGIAVLTWLLVGWQTWLAFKPSQTSQPQTGPQVLCWDGPCAPTHKKSGPEYLKEIGLGGAPGQPLMLQATSAATSERLRVFVDYSEYRNGWMPKTRAFIGEIKEPVKGKIERLPLIVQATKENAGQNTLWWGDAAQNNPVTTPTYSSNIPAILVRARLAIIGPSGEQHHYFMLVRGAENIGTYVGVLPEHDSGDWIETWEKE